MPRSARNAFTLVELLIVVAVIGVLIGLLLPAVQHARESARRMQCQNNLLQLVLAVQQHEAAYVRLPSGVVDSAGPVQNVEAGNHLSWIAHVLPYLEQGNTFNKLDFAGGAYAPKNVTVRPLNLRVLTCPSIGPTSWIAVSNYAGCHHEQEAPIDADNHGVLFLNSRVRYDDISDGRAHTIFLGEKLSNDYAGKLRFGTGIGLPDSAAPDDPIVSDLPPEGAQPAPPMAAALPSSALGDLGWLSGTRATLRNTGTPINRTGDSSNSFRRANRSPPAAANSPLWVGGFESVHGGGAQFAMGDGSVRFFTEQISMTIYQQLGHRADGQLLSDAGF